RAGSALRTELGVRREERVVLLMLDGPEMIYTFFGAIKIGAVPIPTNTLWTTEDYKHVLRDSGARVVVVSGSLWTRVADAARASPTIQHVVMIGEEATETIHQATDFESLVNRGSPVLQGEPTNRGGPAFWLPSSGSTGRPKGCVHLQHDMSVCADAYARGVLGIHARDRFFSVAKLFFAYGLGNSMYFPLAVGATSILWPGPVTPPQVYEL